MRLMGAPVPCLRIRGASFSAKADLHDGTAYVLAKGTGRRQGTGAAMTAPSQQRENALRCWEKQP
jgi:hypothetical protein